MLPLEPRVPPPPANHLGSKEDVLSRSGEGSPLGNGPHIPAGACEQGGGCGYLDNLLNPGHTSDADTPLRAEFSKAMAFSENWVSFAAFLGKIPNPASHRVSGKNYYLQEVGVG